MKTKCAASGKTFEIYPEDLAFYEKASPVIRGQRMLIPPPTLCPDERQRRRIAFRNERKLYHRKCLLTGREIISIYSPEKPFTVYDQKEWWSDRWDPSEYGREFDFSRSFFEQFGELFKQVPRAALFNRNSINCDYTNISADNKNCYILIESSNNEECHYSYWMQKCRDCIDSSFCYQCELCYEVANCINCYNLRYSYDCKDCSESAFLQSCQGCRDCLGCINLRQKQYCIFNQQYSKETYLAKLEEFRLSTHQGVEQLRRVCADFFIKFPRKFAEIINADGCSGSYIANSSNCFSCYHAFDAKDCRYSVHVWRNAKDIMDTDTAGRDAELIYESINNGISDYHNIFCMTCWTAHHLIYCDTTSSAHDCFGCVGLRNKEYCILNKQYARSEYELMLIKIIEHMKKTGEWGEFFPVSHSPFGYNETVAQDYFPLTEAEAKKRGFRWHQEDESSRYQGKQITLPDNIKEVDQSYSRAILTCETSKRPYKIIPQELEFYKKVQVPAPRRAPDQRHKDRMATRNPRTLYERNCVHCEAVIRTPYSPERPEIVYCEKCYENCLDTMTY